MASTIRQQIFENARAQRAAVEFPSATTSTDSTDELRRGYEHLRSIVEQVAVELSALRADLRCQPDDGSEIATIQRGIESLRFDLSGLDRIIAEQRTIASGIEDIRGLAELTFEAALARWDGQLSTKMEDLTAEVHAALAQRPHGVTSSPTPSVARREVAPVARHAIDDVQGMIDSLASAL